MKLHYKILMSVSAMIAFVVAVLAIVVYSQFNATLKAQMEFSAMDMATTFASMGDIQHGLQNGATPEQIQSIVEPIRKNTRYQYIIVMDMTGKQYSYPYESGLGKPYKNGGESRVLDQGETYLLADSNQLISAIRAFVPITHDGKQLGAVLVGLLTDQVKVESEIHQRSLELALVVSVCIGIIVAYFLSMNIKKSIFGLEPKEIGLLLSERDLIFQSMDKGIIAVDTKGKLLLSNDKARTLLGLPTEADNQVLSAYASGLSSRLMQALEKRTGCENETFAIHGANTVVINVCLMHDSKHEVTGVVASIEDLIQARAFAEEITDYRALVDTLRAQNHEFMNKLHTVSGLLQLGHLDEAIDFVDQISQGSSQLDHLLTEHIRDHKLAGLLLSKYNQFSEKRVQLEITDESHLVELPDKLNSEELCSIVGNLLDNSFDSIIESDVAERKISFFINDLSDMLEIEIYNTGPEIDEMTGDAIFNKGYTTKKDGQGIGLYLVKSIVSSIGGTIEWQNDEGVFWHVVIPFD